MKKKGIFISVMLIAIFLSSCKKKDKVFNEENSLVLEILTEEFNAYLPYDSIPTNAIFTDTIQLMNKGTNKLKLKLKNISPYAYLFVTACGSDGCSRPNTFPENLSSIDLANINFYNSKGELSEIYRAMYDSSLLESIEIYQEKATKSFYDTNYPEKNERWRSINSEISKKWIVIHPGEELYFETNFTLPFNFIDEASILNRVDLKTNENYSAEISLKAGFKNMEKWLTSSQIETIKANNYKIFNGTLRSVNKVPVVLNK